MTTWVKSCRLNKDTTFKTWKEFLRILTKTLDQKLKDDDKIEVMLFKNEEDTILSIKGFTKDEEDKL